MRNWLIIQRLAEVTQDKLIYLICQLEQEKDIKK